jgi:hypothetical protein
LTISIGEIDVRRLMGGEAFTVPCSLASNGNFVDNISTLPDSGANGFAFINTHCALDISKFLGLQAYRLEKPIGAKGYDGRQGQSITHVLVCDLMIDNRRLKDVPFLMLDLGNHDIILGAKWMAYFDILPDLRRRRLVWPKALPPTSELSFARKIRVSRNSLLPRPVHRHHQADVERRSRAFAHEERQDAAGRRSRTIPEIAVVQPSLPVSLAQQRKPEQKTEETVPETAFPLPTTVLPRPARSSSIRPTPLAKTHSQQLRWDISAMDKELRAAHSESLHNNDFVEAARIRKQAERRKKQRYAGVLPVPAAKLLSLDICEISAPAFHLNLQRTTNHLFSTSICEIDRELEDRTSNMDDEELQELYAKLPKYLLGVIDNFSKAASDTLPPRRPYDHKIELEADHNLGHGPLYSQTTEELVVMKQYLLDNLDKGFIVPSQAPYSSPVLFVKKPNGSLRFCIDFRKLNTITRKDRYPLPLIDETLARLTKAKIFTKLDIRQAFHRIRMHASSEDLTTFRTRYGAYKCKVLPFGLTNGPATYQRYMNDILIDYLDDFCTAYLDDVLIYSENELEHQEHVLKVLARLREAGLQPDIKKCEFSVTRTKYLGFIVTTKGIEVDPEKVAVIKDWKPPTTVKGTQSFLGFCNFYRRFIRDYGTTAKPLTRLTRIGVDYNWDASCDDAFEKLKRSLVEAPVLAHYDPGRETMLETDASDGVVAAVLSQQNDKQEWHPVAFFSKTMAPAELNYQIHDKEMLAIVKALKNWRAELQGSPTQIKVLTDHKSLEYFMTSKQLKSRQARWSELLADFYFHITYRPGRANELADALSRREQDIGPQDNVKKEIRMKPLLEADQVDPQIRAEMNLTDALSQIELFAIESLPLVDAILRANRSHASLDSLREDAETGNDYRLTLDEGLLLRDGCLVVPDTDQLRTQLIREAHTPISQAHPSPGKTIKMLRERYYWKGMKSDVTTYLANCAACRRSHQPRGKTPGFLHPLPIPQYRWQHICVDFKSFPPDRAGYDNIVVFIDRLSKEAISIPCTKEATATDLAHLFYTHVYRHHNVPESIVSDRGPQFISQFWNAFCSLIGTKVKLSTAFHPQTDGQTEIMNQYIDQRLRPYVNHYQDNWAEMLPALDNAQLTLPHASIGMSPYELSHGIPPRKSFDWKEPAPPETARDKLSQAEARKFVKSLEHAYEFVKSSMAKAQAANQQQANKKRREVDFDVGDTVYLLATNLKTDRPSKKLADQQSGPWRVKARHGHSFELELPSWMKIHPVFSPQLLRKAATNPLPGQLEQPQPPVNITGDNEYELSAIRAVRKRWNRLEYQADWLGHDQDPQYYPASDFKYAPHLLRKFHQDYPLLPGPPEQLLEWLKAYEEGIEVYDYLDSNKAMDEPSRTRFFRGGG